MNKVIIFPYILTKSFVAVTIYPFIILKKEEFKDDFVLINHEKIHIRQQIEMLWFAFFLWFAIEYLIRLIQYRDFYLAYKNISFEREAYANEHCIDYLSTRPPYTFLKYIRRT
jgi:hypothetical protein